MPLPSPDHIAAHLAALPPQERAPKEAAVAVALRWGPDPDVLLMQRRARDGDPWSGQVSFPGGHREAADRDLVHTACREAHEELGIDLATDATALGQLSPIQAMARGERVNLWITPVLFQVTAPLDPQPSAEAEAAFWLPLTRAARGDFDHRYHYQDKRRKLLLPAWQFEKRIIWGLTFRMLTALLHDLVPPTPPQDS